MKASWVRFTLFLCIALAAALWPSVFGGKVLLPLDLLSHNPPHSPPADAAPVHNPLIGDMVYENYTWKVFQKQTVAAGDPPFWNPYTFCGHPLYTTGQSSTFYPLNAIFWLMPPERAYVVFIGLHLLLGGLFTYLLFRRLGVGDFGATIGGLVFAMGGFLACRLVFPMLLASAIWLPLMLLWLDRMTERRTRWATLTGLAWGAPLFALPILGGFFEIAFYGFVACGLFALVQCAKLIRRRSAPEGMRYAVTSAVVVLLAAVIAAPQILPFLEVMKLNVRAGEGTYETARATALAGKELLTAVMPDALGNPTIHESFNLATRQWNPIDHGHGYHYFGPKNYVEVGWYLGILPITFALLSVRAPGRERFFFWLLLVIAVCLALVTPLYRVFFHLVPGSEQVRTPFRWMFPACFAVTYLAALGAQYWFDRMGKGPTRSTRVGAGLIVGIAVAMCAVMAILLFMPGPVQALAHHILEVNRQARSTFRSADEFAGLLWMNGMRLAIFLLGAAVLLGLGAWRTWKPRGAMALSLAAVAFVALDLGLASFSFNTHADPGVLDRVPPVVQHLQDDDALFRIGRFGPDKILYANFPTLYGLQDYGGYDSIILRNYAEFLGGIEPQHLLRYNIVMTLEKRSSLDSPLLPLLNIRYLLTQRKIAHPDWQEVPAEGEVRLYRIREDKELPRAFLVNQVRAVNSRAEAIAALKTGSVDIRKEAVVQASNETSASLAEPGPSRATASISEYRASSVTVTTHSDRRALLVLCDVYYPGWKAYVDGTPSDVLVANGVFRGVSVPAGQHTVVLRFEPFVFRLGAVLSLACLAALVILGLAGRYSRDTASPPPLQASSEAEPPSPQS